MIRYLFMDGDGDLICVARTWPVWRQMIRELSGDPEAALVIRYADDGMPAGVAVSL